MIFTSLLARLTIAVAISLQGYCTSQAESKGSRDVYPAGGETAVQFEEFVVSWNEDMFSNDNVRLVEVWNYEAATWSLVAYVQPGIGRFTWYPDLDVGNQYRVRIRGGGVALVSDGYFSIIAGPPCDTVSVVGDPRNLTEIKTSQQVDSQLHGRRGVNQFNVSLPGLSFVEQVELSVYNFLGERVSVDSKVTGVNNSEYEVSLNIETSGLYFIMIVSDVFAANYVMKID